MGNPANSNDPFIKYIRKVSRKNSTIIAQSTNGYFVIETT